jgi:hypothetical protein
VGEGKNAMEIRTGRLITVYKSVIQFFGERIQIPLLKNKAA